MLKEGAHLERMYSICRWMCALNDVVILRDFLARVDDLSDWKEVSRVLHQWHWRRKALASTVNILSVALYDLFGADGKFTV